MIHSNEISKTIMNALADDSESPEFIEIISFFQRVAYEFSEFLGFYDGGNLWVKLTEDEKGMWLDIRTAEGEIVENILWFTDHLAGDHHFGYPVVIHYTDVDTDYSCECDIEEEMMGAVEDIAKAKKELLWNLKLSQQVE